jgi:hypothetical protein
VAEQIPRETCEKMRPQQLKGHPQPSRRENKCSTALAKDRYASSEAGKIESEIACEKEQNPSRRYPRQTSVLYNIRDNPIKAPYEENETGCKTKPCRATPSRSSNSNKERHQGDKGNGPKVCFRKCQHQQAASQSSQEQIADTAMLHGCEPEQTETRSSDYHRFSISLRQRLLPLNVFFLNRIISPERFGSVRAALTRRAF